MLKRNFAVVIVVTVLLGAGAYAWAQEPPERPEKQAQEPDKAQGADSPRAKRAGHRLRGLRRTVHADVTFEARDGAFRTVQIDRGTLVSASETSVTVERADGEQVTRAVTDDTKVRGVDTIAELVDGAPTLVVAEGGTALVVGQRKDESSSP